VDCSQKLLSHVSKLHYYFRSRHGQPREAALSQSSPTDYLLLREGYSETSEADAMVVKQVQLFVLKESKPRDSHESTLVVDHADLRCKG
jgi:hypothetical protein